MNHSAAGVIVIAVSSATGARTDAIGIVLSLLAALSYAIGVVSQKPLLGHLSALTVTWLACTVGGAGFSSVRHRPRSRSAAGRSASSVSIARGVRRACGEPGAWRFAMLRR